MLKCKNVFWLENLTDLFCDFRIIPFKNMNLESQMNSLTRLVFFIFILLLFFLDLKNSLIFLILSLLIIIIFYYIKKRKMEQYKEMFTYNMKNKNGHKSEYKGASEQYQRPPPYQEQRPQLYQQAPPYQQQYLESPFYEPKNDKPIDNFNPFGDYKRGILDESDMTKDETIIIDRPQNFINCNDEVPFDFNNPNYMSINQKLVGKANPKTLIPPVIVPPITDLGYWKTNNLIKHSLVNDQSQIDVYQSGYQVSTCCGSDNKNMYLDDNEPKLLRKRIPVKNIKYKQSNYAKNKDNNLDEYTEIKENFKVQKEKNDLIKQNFKKEQTNDYPYIIDNTDNSYQNDFNKNVLKKIKSNQSGEVNVSCGYNPKQLHKYGLPTNYPSGICERDPVLKDYNKNLFTQTIQPGVYSYNEINEPLNSNIGISFTQQIGPITVNMDENEDSITYVQHDPRLYEEPIEPYVETVNESNVYDPRFSGYGTSYRAYTDDNIGQTRFYYDDIDSVRMPNYITRSNIDFMKAADTYGPMENEHGNKYNSIIRNLANDKFLESTLTFRTGLQESAMRKMNANKWQQRQAPIYT